LIELRFNVPRNTKMEVVLEMLFPASHLASTEKNLTVENLSSLLSMHTQAGSAFDDHMTLTF